jgi:hypothetical protein
MHFRRDRQNVNGQVLIYLSVVHDVFEDGPRGKARRSKPIVLVNLGREDRLDLQQADRVLELVRTMVERRCGERPVREALELLAVEFKTQEKRLRLLASNNPLDFPEGPVATSSAKSDAAPVSEPELRMLSSRDLGFRLLLEAAWENLGLGESLAAFAAGRRVEFDLERVVFAMIYNRLADAKSKHACNQWIQDRAYMPEAKSWQVHQYYRAMDVLHDHWQDVEGAMRERIQQGMTSQERNLHLVDTTSLYFEARHNDRELAELAAAWDEADADMDVPDPKRSRPAGVNVPPFRMQGHNKDGHPGDPQVVIASECTSSGYVLRHSTYPGNTNDSTIAKDLLLRTAPLAEGEEKVWVSDAGMLSKTVLKLLGEKGWRYLLAEGPRKSVVGPTLLSDTPGRFRGHTTKPHLGFKWKDVAAAESPSLVPERWVATRNEKEQERQRAQLERRLDRASRMLSKQELDERGHPKSVCKVVTHPKLSRLVEPSKKVTGTYILSQKGIAKERQLAGIRFYRTNKLDWEPQAMFDAYQALQAVEANHKLFKGPLKLQPCYHRTTGRIEAHVMLTIAASNCVRYLEQKTGLTYQELAKLFGGVSASLMEQGTERYWLRSELTKAHLDVLEDVGARVPDRKWAVSIEAPRPASKGRMIAQKPTSRIPARA